MSAWFYSQTVVLNWLIFGAVFKKSDILRILIYLIEWHKKKKKTLMSELKGWKQEETANQALPIISLINIKFDSIKLFVLMAASCCHQLQHNQTSSTRDGVGVALAALSASLTFNPCCRGTHLLLVLIKTNPPPPPPPPGFSSSPSLALKRAHPICTPLNEVVSNLAASSPPSLLVLFFFFFSARAKARLVKCHI